MSVAFYRFAEESASIYTEPFTLKVVFPTSCVPPFVGKPSGAATKKGIKNFI